MVSRGALASLGRLQRPPTAASNLVRHSLILSRAELTRSTMAQKKGIGRAQKYATRGTLLRREVNPSGTRDEGAKDSRWTRHR